MAFTLDQIQEVFGREIAGNHTVYVTFDDGAVLCSALVEIDGVTEVVWFIGHDVHLSDWDLTTAHEAKQIIAEAARFPVL
jgi:hypothetical protein